MTHKSQVEFAASIGLKVVSSALLIQQASTLPAYAHRDDGHRGQHQGRTRDGADLVNALRQMQSGGALAHFGLEKLDRVERNQARDFARPMQHLPQLANTTRLGRNEMPRLNKLTPLEINYSNGNIDLDLSSSTGSIVVQTGMIKGDAPVTISVGGSDKTINAGDTVTASEFVALLQAQSKGGQTLTVDQSGKATGGNFSLETLTSDLGVKLDDVLIPQNVQSLDTVSKRSQVTITGDLVNYGNINQTLRGKSADVVFTASDISNQVGAVISGTARGKGEVNLGFVSTEFQNDGRIITSGSIDIKARGDSFKNSGEISAKKDVSIESAHIVNSGLVRSVDGNITLDTAKPMSLYNIGNVSVGAISIGVGELTDSGGSIIIVPSDTTTSGSVIISAGSTVFGGGTPGSINTGTAGGGSIFDITPFGGVTITTSANISIYDGSKKLTVNNEGGTFEAQNGNINLRASDYTGKSGAVVTGGDLLSQKLVLNSGGGTIDVNVNRLTGEVVSSGTAVHVQAITDNLTIGSQCLTGDPTYFNPGGDISITGNINVAEALAIIASGNISTDAGVTLIQARTGGGVGQPISIIAGVNVTGSGTATTTMPPGTPATGNVTFSGGSATGGNVDFSASTSLAINSNSTSAGNVGANVLIAAYANGGAGGRVLLAGTSNIDASGASTNDAYGFVRVFASNPIAGQTALQLGSVTHAGNFGAQGVFLYNATPTFSSGASMTFDQFGNITSGNILIPDFSQLQAGNIVASGVGGGIFALGGLEVAGGGDFVSNKFLVTRSVVGIKVRGNVQVPVVASPAGILVVAGQNITFDQMTTATNGPNAGDLSLIAGAVFTATPSEVTITGGTTLGGTITSSQAITTSSFPAVDNGFAGDLTIVSFGGSLNGGVFTDESGPLQTWTTTGTALGSNGNVTIVTPALDVDNITSANGVVNGGDMFISIAAVPVSGTNQLVFDNFGTKTAGNLKNGTPIDSDMSAFYLTALGRSIELETGGSFQTLLPINANAANSTGNGGSIKLTSQSADQIANLNLSVDGGSTSGNAGSITLINTVGGVNAGSGNLSFGVTDGNAGIITIDAGSALLDVHPVGLILGAGGNGNGAEIRLRFGSLDNNGSFNPPIIAANGSGTGNGGFIELIDTNGDELRLQDNGFTIQATSGASGGNGGTVRLENLTGTVRVFEGDNINVRPLANLGDGGTIRIVADNVTTGFGTSTAFDVSANATGMGGVIDIFSASGLTIGTQEGQFQLTANGGTTAGHGGTILVGSDNNIIVDPTVLSANPQAIGNGGTYRFSGSNVFVNGSLSADAAGPFAGGTIGIITDTPTDLIYNSKKVVNGVLGTLSVNGATLGTIELTNNGGSVSIPVALTEVGQLILRGGGTTGNITSKKGLGGADTSQILITTDGDEGNIISKKPMVGTNLNFTTSNGFIGGKKAIKINAENISAIANGAVNLTNLSESALSTLFDVSSANGDVTYTALADIVVFEDIMALNGSVLIRTTGDNAAINLHTTGNITADQLSGTIDLFSGKKSGSIGSAAGVASAFNVNLVAYLGEIGFPGNPMFVNTKNLTFEAVENVFIANVGSSTLNINRGESDGQAFVDSQGSIMINASFKSPINTQIRSLGNDGSILVASTIGSTKQTEVITLKADGAGSITQASNKIRIISTDDVTLETGSGSIGTPSQPLVVDTRGLLALNPSATSGQFLRSVAKDGTYIGGVSGGDLVFNAVSNSGVSNNLTAKSIFIATEGGVLGLATSVQSTDGGITFLNGGKGKGSMIDFFPGVVVSSFSLTPGGGEIQVVVGELPPLHSVGTAPANVVLTGNGTVFFNEGITALAPNNLLDTKNTNITFSSGELGPASIVLRGGVIISADPPEPAPAMVTVAVEPSSRSNAKRNQIFAAKNNALSVPTSSEQARSAGGMQLNTSFDSSQMINTLVPQDSSILSSSSLTLSPAESSAQIQLQSNVWTTGIQPGWISETELESGEIPAKLHFNEAASNGQNLNSGSMLVAPMTDVSIETPLGAVQVAANSLVLVMSFDDGVAIFNFDDSNRHSVRLNTGDKQLSIAPGQSLIVTRNSNAALCDINPAQLIAHRSVTERHLGNGLKAIHSEFSVPSALAAVVPIKSLMSSKHPHAVRTAKHLLKTTSVLLQLQSGGSNFEQHRKPQRTASL